MKRYAVFTNHYHNVEYQLSISNAIIHRELKNGNTSELCNIVKRWLNHIGVKYDSVVFTDQYEIKLTSTYKNYIVNIIPDVSNIKINIGSDNITYDIKNVD